MIPICLPAAEAQHLIGLGRARLLGPEHLTTARVAYLWSRPRVVPLVGVVVILAGLRSSDRPLGLHETPEK